MNLYIPLPSDRKAKIVLAAFALVILGLIITACNGSGGVTNGNAAEARTSTQDLTTYEQVQPAPHFPYSDIRQTMIDVQASQALGLVTTSFFFNMGSQDPYFICPSKGDPVPNTSQLTNPDQVLTWWHGGAQTPDQTAVVGNIDPNGLYAPSASDGTNVMCLNGAGQPYLFYAEGPVSTVNGHASWDYIHHHIVVTGEPVMPNCKVTGAGKQARTVCTK